MYVNWEIEGYDYRQKVLNDMSVARHHLNDVLNLLDKHSNVDPDIILYSLVEVQDAIEAAQELCHEVIELTENEEDVSVGVKLKPLTVKQLKDILP